MFQGIYLPIFTSFLGRKVDEKLVYWGIGDCHSLTSVRAQ